jgi:hypothetical protein
VGFFTVVIMEQGPIHYLDAIVNPSDSLRLRLRLHTNFLGSITFN